MHFVRGGKSLSQWTIPSFRWMLQRPSGIARRTFLSSFPELHHLKSVHVLPCCLWVLPGGQQLVKAAFPPFASNFGINNIILYFIYLFFVHLFSTFFEDMTRTCSSGSICYKIETAINFSAISNQEECRVSNFIQWSGDYSLLRFICWLVAFCCAS